MTTWSLNLQPRGWQEEAFRRWQQNQRGVISVVTGGGKTLFAFMCMLDFIKRFPHGQILILVPTKALLDQWFVSLQEDLAVHSDEISVYSGEERPRTTTALNLMILNTARNKAIEIIQRTDTLLIVDECHRAGSPINALALRGQPKATLGLSATPTREYDDGFETKIAPIIGPIIYEYSYEDASVDGIVSPFVLVNVRVDFLDAEARKYNQLSRKVAVEWDKVRKGQSDSRLKHLLNQRASVSANAAMRIPIAARLVDENRRKRTLVFHERVAAANALANILSQRNHSVAVYHTGIGPVVRRDNLRMYRKGLVDVLVTCRALDEGLNVPETTVAVVASATASLRQRVQRLGRVLRPAPGKKEATIYSIYVTDAEEQRLLNEAKNLRQVSSIQWQHGARIE